MSGILLLIVAIDFQKESSWKTLAFFLGLGLFCIAGAILYTAGKKPYGYMGLGDIAVLIFFAWVAGLTHAACLFLDTLKWKNNAERCGEILHHKTQI